MPTISPQLQGILWMLLHCIILSIVSGMVRGLSENLPIFQIVFLYNLCGSLALLPFAAPKYKLIFSTTKIKTHLSRAFIGTTSMAIYFYALTLMPLNEATAISFSAPLFASLAAVLFCGERLGVHRSLGLILGFSGVLIILRPGADAFQIGAIFILAAVVLWTVNTFIIKHLGKSEPTITQVFYLTVFSTFFALPMAISDWQPVTPEFWLSLAFIGTIYMIRTIAVFNAFKLADVTVVAPFDFSRLVFVAIIAYVYFEETLDSWTVIGSTIIVGSHVYIAHRETRRKTL